MIHVFVLQLNIGSTWKQSQAKSIVTMIIIWCFKKQLIYHNRNKATKYGKISQNCNNLNLNIIAVAGNHITIINLNLNASVNGNHNLAANIKFISTEIQQLCHVLRINHVENNIQSNTTNKNVQNKTLNGVQDSVLETLMQNVKILDKSTTAIIWGTINTITISPLYICQQNNAKHKFMITIAKNKV